MHVVRPSDPRAFVEAARPLLAADPPAEARHNLILGLAGTLADDPKVYPTHHLWVVLDGDRPVAAALMTPPYNLVLAEPSGEEALDALLGAVRADEAPVPGIVGNLPHVRTAAERWAAASGVTERVVQSQGVYALTRMLDVRRPAQGAPRAASAADRELLLRWLTDFAAEALPTSEDAERIERSIDARVAGAHTGLWFWTVEDEPVSLAGWSGRTPSGIRVGPVYTPTEHRRRGYATNLVAELSRQLLSQGYRACFLYTDLANPTSNRIYGDIGYERVADSVEYRFSS
jgi:uncharacterized protein